MGPMTMPWSGRGFLGWPHAYHLARRGRRVVVFERNARASGAFDPQLRYALADWPTVWAVASTRHEKPSNLAGRAETLWSLA